MCRSSTWREIEAARRVLHNYMQTLKHKHVKIFTDNKNVDIILNTGSRNSDLHGIALEINDNCKNENIILSSQWIPRALNKRADYLSRCYDCDDWAVSSKIFSLIDNMWGPHDIDRFASHLNNQCERFNARWWVPGVEAIDCFTQKWQGCINWLVPPPRCIARCIQKIEAESASCTLVVPEWKSAPFWPLILAESGRFKKYIVDIYVFPRKGSICKGSGNNGMFTDDVLSFRILGLKIRCA